MSNEKTIEVLEGDTWTGIPWTVELFQYRRGQWRGFSPVGTHDKWHASDRRPEEFEVPADKALSRLLKWGYTLTRGEGEKHINQVEPVFPEDRDALIRLSATEQEPCLSVGGLAVEAGLLRAPGSGTLTLGGSDHHVPDAGKKVEAKSPPPDLPNANDGKAGLDKLTSIGVQAACDVASASNAKLNTAIVDAFAPSAPTVKPDLTADVPVVDAVWVLTKWPSGEVELDPFASPAAATRKCGRQLADGTARIVRLASVDDESRSMIDDTRNTVRELDKAAFQFDERLAALESRLAKCETNDNYVNGEYSALDADVKAIAARLDTLETNVAAADARLVQRLEKVEKDKPAARVVKAPKPPVYGDGDWLKGVQWEAKRWVSELTSQGITVADEGEDSK